MTKEKYKINYKLTDKTFYAAYRVAYLQKIHYPLIRGRFITYLLVNESSLSREIIMIVNCFTSYISMHNLLLCNPPPYYFF